MNTFPKLVLLSASLGVAGCLTAHRAQTTRQAPAAEKTATVEPAESERLLGVGKKLFVEKCGKCHNERGDKPLPDGPPLNERKLTDEVIEKSVNSRFRTATPDERRGVVLYIKGFLKKQTRPVAAP